MACPGASCLCHQQPIMSSIELGTSPDDLEPVPLWVPASVASGVTRDILHVPKAPKLS